MKNSTNVLSGSVSRLCLRDKIKLTAIEHNWIPSAWLRYRLNQDLSRWKRSQPGPFPHLLKQRIVLEYAKRSGARVFVETGTFYGFMLQACLDHFDMLVSIEIEPHFYRRATRVFRSRSNVRILNGDSGKILPELVGSITGPALFWLDAHWSGGLTGKGSLETPIRQELEAILAHPCRRHTVLIDDANCFDATSDYPELEWIHRVAEESGYSVSLSDNIIRLTQSGRPENETNDAEQYEGTLRPR